jgi:hypothetical protein
MHVPLQQTLCRGPAFPCRRHYCGWLPRAVLAPVAMGVSDFWVLDLRRLGPLLHKRLSMSSRAIFTSSSGPSSCFRAVPVARGSTRHYSFLLLFSFFFFPLVALAYLCISGLLCILGLLSCISGFLCILGLIFICILGNGFFLGGLFGFWRLLG